MIHIILSGESRNPLGSVASLDTCIYTGFGEAKIYKDGVVYYDGNADDEDDIKVLSDFEEIAKTRPGEWKLVMNAPLWNATWVREGDDKWVCVETGMGFA